MEMIEGDHLHLSVRKQCSLLSLNRSTYYREPAVETALNLELMNELDRQYMEAPFYGRYKHTEWLRNKGYDVNHKRVHRLMTKMGISALTPKPKTTVRRKGHEIYPYLLKELEIVRPNQVWTSDITWIPVNKGYLYLVAVMDWWSRYILSWSLSGNMEVDFCTEALEQAFDHGCPEIFNTDQGSQFTSYEFTGILKAYGVKISMDGKGRYLDNIMIERVWRSLKYEEVYLKKYETAQEAYEGIRDYINFYNHHRIHMSLGKQTPVQVYRIGGL